MKHRHLLCASFLLAAPLTADDVIHHQPGSFFNQTDFKEILLRYDVGEDIIVLRDGTQLKGKVSGLPEVNFSFGTFPLRIDDVAAIAFFDVDGKTKMQLITQDGYSFITGLTGNRIPFIQNDPDIKDLKGAGHQEIDIAGISHILLRRGSYASQPKPSRLHILELNNGNQFPVLIAEEEISLSNGWEIFSLRPDALINVSFDGGLYGTVCDRVGNESDLDFSFVNDRFLRVKVLRSPQTIGIPWSEVYAIRKQKIPAYEVAEFIARNEGVADKKEPLSVLSEKSTDRLPEIVSWIEAPEPKARFDLDSAQVGDETIAWLDKIPLSPSVEEKQIAMLVQEKSRLVQDWNSRQQSLQGKLTQTAKDSVKLQSRLQEMEEFNHELETHNRELAEAARENFELNDDLQKKQVYLVSAIELEMTRSNVLRNSLLDLYEKWMLSTSELKQEKEFAAQLQDKLGFLIDSLEMERNSRQEMEETLQHAKQDALEFERQVAQLSQDVVVRENRVFELQNSLENKYQEIKEVFQAQRQIHQDLLGKIFSLEEEKESAEIIRKKLESQLAEVGQIEGLKLLLAESENEIAKLEEERGEAVAEAARIQNQYQELQLAILVKTAIDPELYESPENLHPALLSIVGQMVSGDLMTEKVDGLNQEIEEAHTFIADLQERLVEMSEKINLASTVDQEKEETLSAKVEEIAELRRFYGESEEQLSKQVGMLISEIDTANGNVESLSGELALARRNTDEKEVIILDLQRSLVEAQAAAHEMEMLLAKKEEQLKDKDENIVSLASQLETFIAKHEMLANNRAELEALVNMLKEILDLKEAEIVELGDSLELKNEELAQLRHSHDVEIAFLNERMREFEKDKNAVQDLLTKTRDELDDKDFQIDSLVKAQENYFAIREKLDELENERETIFIEREDTVNQYNRLKEEFDILDQRNGELNERLSTVQAESGEATGEVNKLRKQLVSERKKSEDFKKKMDLLFPQYDMEKEKGQKLQEQLVRMDARLRSLENALRVAETKEVSAHDRLGKLSQENQQLSREKEVLLQQLGHEQSRLKEQRDLSTRLNQSLHSQKSTLDRMEKSQVELVSELESARSANTHLINQYHQPDYQADTEHKPVQGATLISFKGIHIVASGENLNNISMKYYNTPHRWADIYEANHDVITDVNKLQLGTPLVIPD